MKRLCLLHTVVFLADLFKQKLAARYPDLDSFHVVDESLLKDLLAAGQLTPGVIRRVAGQVFLAREAGAELILFTCSSTSPAVDAVRKLVDIPILKIDDPMARQAVLTGKRIGVVATARSTKEASKNLLLSHAMEQDRDVEVTVKLEEEAFAAVMSGDKARHDELVKKAALDLSKNNDVVVLAQASMAHLAPELNQTADAPVLVSPDMCVEALENLL